MIYLDNAATTPVDKLVLDKMVPYFYEKFWNPGAVYSAGRDAKKAVDSARQEVADFLGCTPDHIIFTSGGSEGNNAVFEMVIPYLKSIHKNKVLVSAVEHSSVMNCAQNLLVKHGFHSGVIPVDVDGIVDAEDVKSLITDGVGLVSVMYINNETGAMNDVKGIAKVCHEKGVLYHVDAVQAAGCTPINIEEIGCDFLTISSHKIHGPKGVGALYVRDSFILTPMISGGSAQEFGLRGGTENVPGIVGFGEACRITGEYLRAHPKGYSDDKKVFIKTLNDFAESFGVHPILNCNTLDSPSPVISIRFDGADSEAMVVALGMKGICVSSGSACNSNSSRPSRVLTEIGLNEIQARNTIRISIGRDYIPDREYKAAMYWICACAKQLIILGK